MKIINKIEEFQTLILKIENKVEIIPNVPSLNPYWILAWWETFGKDANIFIVYLEINEVLVLLLPLRIDSKNGKKVLEFFSYNCSDYLEAVYQEKTDEKDYIKLFDYIFSSIDFDEIRFDNLLTGNFYNHFSKYLLSKGIGFKIEVKEKISKILLNNNFIKKFENRKRDEYYRKKVKLESKGKLEFKYINTYNQEQLESLFSISNDNWSRRGVYAPFNEIERRNFMHKLCSYFSSSGNLSIYLLYHNNLLIAYRLGFKLGNIYYDWNTSYDYNYGKYSPGIILLNELIKHSIKNSILEIDFMKGNETYKHVYSNKTSFVNCLSIYKNKNGTPKAIMPKLSLLKSKKGFIFDLDGVVYNGAKPIQETIDGIKKLQKAGKKILFNTNTNVRFKEEIQKKLLDFNITATKENIITSGDCMLYYLTINNIKNCKVYGGGKYLPQILAKSGIKINSQNPEAIVIGYSEDLTYNHFVEIVNFLKSGAKLIGTDRDIKYSYNNEIRLGTGWIISVLEKHLDYPPIIVGKPSRLPIDLALKQFNLSHNEVVFIGDNLFSDIKAANNAGIDSILLLGGVSTFKDIEKTNKCDRPTYIINSFNQVVETL